VIPNLLASRLYSRPRIGRYAYFVSILIRHGYLLCVGRLARWRLETFGLYMPSIPNARPWWRVNGRALRQLLRQRRAYARWVCEMRELEKRGDSGWWRARLNADVYRALESYIREENRPVAADEAGW
jgi:hypothetical protein